MTIGEYKQIETARKLLSEYLNEQPEHNQADLRVYDAHAVLESLSDIGPEN